MIWYRKKIFLKAKLRSKITSAKYFWNFCDILKNLVIINNLKFLVKWNLDAVIFFVESDITKYLKTWQNLLVFRSNFLVLLGIVQRTFLNFVSFKIMLSIWKYQYLKLMNRITLVFISHNFLFVWGKFFYVAWNIKVFNVFIESN